MHSAHQMPTRTTATAYWHIGIVIVAIALCPVATRALSTPTMPTSKPSNHNIVAITHAAGRMGKALALQIREDAELTRMPRDSLPTIKAIVRSEAEAASVKCDLGGVTLIGGKVAPIPLDWLETVVVEDVEGDEGRKLLQEAFEGAGAAILCDASHNEMVWQNENNDAAITNQDDREVCSISVPASENKDLSQRLLAEIEAASHSSTLRHVVMRSSMGLFVDASSEAAQAMGGEAALAGPRKAEEALRSTGLDHTILRLGALTDDAGMIPLIFGIEDSILEKRMDSTTTRRPPILSRSDAARVSTFLLREALDSSCFKGLTIDCSWHPKYGRSSVGSEEAVNAAGRQDLKRGIMEGCKVVQA